MRHKHLCRVIYRSLLSCSWLLLLTFGMLIPAKAAKLAPRQRAIMLVKKAAYAYDRGQYKTAVAYCQEAADAYSTYARAYVWMGASYQKLGNKRAAISAYKWVVALAPSSSDAARARRGLRELGYYRKPLRR